MAYDKPWDEDFQDVPGTPGRGDQFSLGLPTVGRYFVNNANGWVNDLSSHSFLNLGFFFRTDWQFAL